MYEELMKTQKGKNQAAQGDDRQDASLQITSAPG